VNLQSIRRKLDAAEARLSAPAPTAAWPDLDVAGLPADPIERQALTALVMEALPAMGAMPPDAPGERLVALLDAVSRRDGLVWLAALAAARAPVEQFGIDVKAEMLREAETP
jgi:hypothetical protein